MTLIQQGDSGGTRRRCDARCYSASGHKCTCVCGGANHGKGLEQALENTREMAKAMLEQPDTQIAKEIMAQIEGESRCAGIR